MNPQPTIAPIIHNGFRVSLLTDPPGLFEVPGQEDARISIHAGPPVPIACRRAGRYDSGVSVHGDIHIIPAETPSEWEVKGNDTFLTMNVAPALLQRVTETGFAHQSHLAHHMQRMFGVSPRALREMLRQ